MTAYNHAEFSLTHKRAQITDEERRLIDEAIAKGKVQTIPTGKSALNDEEYVWQGDPNNEHSFGALVLKNPMTRADAIRKFKNRMFRAARTPSAVIEHRRNQVLSLTEQGHTAREIANQIGVSMAMVKNDRQVLQRSGRMEKLGSGNRATREDIAARRERIIKLTNEGRTMGEICKIMGLRKSVICNDREALIKQGVLQAKRRVNGEWV